MLKKALSVSMAVMLAVSLSPVAAFASELSSGGVFAELGRGAPAKVSTQAGKTTMYLLSSTDDCRVSYKNGLVSKVTISGGYYQYKYSGKHIVSYHNSVMNGWHYNDGKFTYNKKGRLVKVVSGGTQGTMTYQERYSYNSKGRVSKLVHDRTGDKTTSKFTYNKKGRIAKRYWTFSMPSSSRITNHYSYDAKGNLTKVKGAYSSGFYTSASYKNTYKNGRLVKRTKTDSSSSHTMNYHYKKVAVPKKYVSQVKKQQWAMLNPIASVGVLPVNPFYF